MEPTARLENLENVVRELQVTCFTVQHLLLTTLEAVAKSSPATLADIHENLGTFVNQVRVTSADPYPPLTEQIVTSLERVRSDLGYLLRQ